MNAMFWLGREGDVEPFDWGKADQLVQPGFWSSYQVGQLPTERDCT